MTDRDQTAYEAFTEASGLMELLPPDEPWMWVHHPQRIIVCGGRDYSNRARIREVLAEYGEDRPVIVTGGARGADTLAFSEGRELGYDWEIHPAQWRDHSKAAGPIRNEEMAKLGADLCIAFPGGAGTRDMIRRAEAHDIPVRLIR